jgi:hypothetical protein
MMEQIVSTDISDQMLDSPESQEFGSLEPISFLWAVGLLDLPGS